MRAFGGKERQILGKKNGSRSNPPAPGRFSRIRLLRFVAVCGVLMFSGCLAMYIRMIPRPMEPAASAEGNASAPLSPPPRELKIATLNVLVPSWTPNSLKERRFLILAELQRLRPDVVLLQEVPNYIGQGRQLSRWLAEQLGYAMVYHRSNGSAAWLGFEFGEAILSRYPILEWESHKLPPDSQGIGRRRALRAVTQTPFGRLEIYTTHLAHRRQSDARVLQAAELLRFIERTYRYRELPPILGGDFNDVTDSPVYRTVTDAGFLDAGLRADPPETRPTWGIFNVRDPGQRYFRRFDYIFVQNRSDAPSLEVAGCTRFLDRPYDTASGLLWGSDHAGILAVLRLPDSREAAATDRGGS